MSNSKRVMSWRTKAKAKLVRIAGGSCRLCGYDKCVSALEFHHVDPSEKEFAITANTNTRSFATMINEVRKCILVCANCHREIHSGLVDSELVEERRFIDEDVVYEYTEGVDQAKLEERSRREEEQRAKTQKITDWYKLHPHADHRIKKVDWSQHDVAMLIKEHGSYEAVGRFLGITGAAVKRRLKYLESVTTE